MRIRNLIWATAAGLALAVAPAHAQDASGDPDVVTDGTTSTTDATGDPSGDPTLAPTLPDETTANAGLARGQNRVKTHEFSSQMLPDGSYVERKVSTIEHPVKGTTRIHERSKTTAPDGTVRMEHQWTTLDANGQVIDTRSVSPHGASADDVGGPTAPSTDGSADGSPDGTSTTSVDSVPDGGAVGKPGRGLGRGKSKSVGPPSGPPGLQKLSRPNRPNRPQKASRPSKPSRPGRGPRK